MDGRKEDELKHRAHKLAFELGFDLDAHAVQGVREGVYPLQIALVTDGKSPAVISPYNPAMVHKRDFLSFRVYDFTSPGSIEPSSSLYTLQVLFTPATPANTEFSPFEFDGAVQTQLATTSFSESAANSVAFGPVRAGWDVEWSVGTALEIKNPGRFNFRALLTVGLPKQIARFYRADPEMVVGDPAGPP